MTSARAPQPEAARTVARREGGGNSRNVPREPAVAVVRRNALGEAAVGHVRVLRLLLDAGAVPQRGLVHRLRAQSSVASVGSAVGVVLPRVCSSSASGTISGSLKEPWRRLRAGASRRGWRCRPSSGRSPGIGTSLRPHHARGRRLRRSRSPRGRRARGRGRVARRRSSAGYHPRLPGTTRR